LTNKPGPNRTWHAWAWVLLAIAWMGLIYALSDRPAGDFDDANDAFSWMPFVSTLAHIALYFVLSVFVLRAIVLLNVISNGLAAYSTVFVALIYGILDEIHQSGVEGRSSEVGDVLADVFGAVLVVVFWFFLRRYRAGFGDQDE